MPQLNTEFEVFEYRQMKQKNSETVDEFVTRLRRKAETCGFTEKDKELKPQGCKSAKLRRKALQDNLYLTNLLFAARQMELANEQAGKMEKETFEETNSVQTKFKVTKRKSMLCHQGQNKQKTKGQ